jgi:serine/threonine protein kinase
MSRSIVLGTVIEEGSYGTVHRCTFDGDPDHAIKIIPIRSREGIPCIMEPLIMNMITHPYLKSAVYTRTHSSNLYIVSKLAMSDLSKWRSENTPTRDQCIYWMYCILQAVSCLHKLKIVHCDIKPSNILIEESEESTIPKLNDFSQSRFLFATSIENVGRVGTPNYQSPEIWLGRPWNEKSDIWSLGCTFFEMYTGKCLFPNQPQGSEIHTMRESYLNCIHEFFDLDIRPNVEYEPPLKEIFSLLDPELSSFLSKMLCMDQESRFPALELLKHPIFEPYSSEGYAKYSITEITVPRLGNKSFDLSKYDLDPTLTKVATYILLRVSMLMGLDEKSKIKGAIWIASKIVNGYGKGSLEMQELLHSEQVMCNFLSYRLFMFQP